ncbi:MAG: SpoIIE family protein phosphatase [Melioribacteraceae bacterium]|jgi:sigma-B regulation protein RsbU (phosphoserine phosphatase)|nr:SpoIIE family protein phosphatase [Melioribacteraceae bacterium]
MIEKMLVVDDEPDLESMIRQKFRKKINEGRYEFVFASNGLEALSRLLEHKDIGIVLSDINMPEMDGLTLLAKLNELRNPALRTVIVSAYGDMDNIRTAMNRGAYDFVTKPIDFIDLETTIEKTIKELETIRSAIAEHDKLIAMQTDLDTARNIQSAILPKKFPPFPEIKEFEIFAAMEPAKEVGGDLYDFFLLDNNRVGFVIGDVSGKGVPAAIFMAVSRTLIRATALKGIPPEECLTYVNHLLCNESVASMFVTVFYGVLDYKKGTLIYANGGHNPPYILSKEGELKALELTGGLALGVVDGIGYKSKSVQIANGDLIYLYTDGVTEAMNKDYELYSDERLELLIKENCGINVNDIVSRTLDDIKIHADGEVQSDDITILAVKYL